jgi:hypothetical protein
MLQKVHQTLSQPGKKGRKKERKKGKGNKGLNSPKEASLACQEPTLVAPGRQRWLRQG